MSGERHYVSLANYNTNVINIIEPDGSLYTIDQIGYSRDNGKMFEFSYANESVGDGIQ
jgi:hypothetical protein